MAVNCAARVALIPRLTRFSLVASRHSESATFADRQAGEQSPALADRAAASLGRLVFGQLGDIFFELAPADGGDRANHITKISPRAAAPRRLQKRVYDLPRPALEERFSPHGRPPSGKRPKADNSSSRSEAVRRRRPAAGARGSAQASRGPVGINRPSERSPSSRHLD